MRTIGDRLSKFDNADDQSVGTFNTLFDEVPLIGYNVNDQVMIGEITANATTRLLTINNIAIEHSFVRRTKSEEDYIDIGDSNIVDPNDPDWLFYFV
jgi:hypothetical protein